jgi:hypothetical protein
VTIFNGRSSRLNASSSVCYANYLLQIGMRLGTLDVLNSLDSEDAPSGTTANAIRTLDRIIACTKSVHSKHTAPLIQVML